MSRPGVGARWLLRDDLDVVSDAAGQMAADVGLLESVLAGGPPCLRFYRWAPPALSLGRFQDAADVDRAACAHHGVEVVRRPTGGRALLHGGDLTYAVAMGLPAGAAGSVDGVYELVAAALVAGLGHLGVSAEIARHDGHPGGAACMASQRGADLRVGERKLCGSAQVRRGKAVLQHGSVLLERLTFDETDLLHGELDRAALRRTTVTLVELGAPAHARTVMVNLIRGFREALDVDLISTSPSSG